MIGTCVARAHASARAMRCTAAGPPGSTTFPIGAKYSCCASMTMSAFVSALTSRVPVPVGEVPEIRVPPGDVRALQPVRRAPDDVAPDDGNDDDVLDEIVVHA